MYVMCVRWGGGGYVWSGVPISSSCERACIVRCVFASANFLLNIFGSFMYRVASRCFWDTHCDEYANDFFINAKLFCHTTVYCVWNY